MLREHRPKKHNRLSLERLEARELLAADVIISEFSASNDMVLRDSDRDYPDWIELYNAGDQTADLTDWYLTDNPAEPTKWAFPTGMIEPGGFFTVFASGKDFVDRDGVPHTNFRLSSSGEYLALVQPDETTIQTEFSPAYPEQFTDISYGIRMGLTESTIVSTDSNIQLLIPKDDRYGIDWRSNEFAVGDDWLTELNGQPITASIGYESNSGFADAISTDVESIMKGINATAYVRIPFQVEDPASIKDLALNMKYDDGAAVFLNGDIIGLFNASFFITFNSTAQQARDNADAIVAEQIDLGDHLSSLVAGENVLAIQALNISASDDDFLLSAELVATTEGIDRSEYGYFQTPTPGTRNDGEFAIGPIISDVAHEPTVPDSTDPLIVTARLQKTLHDIASVDLVYRVMYDEEVTVAMRDDGQASDSQAGDGIYTAQIPAGIAQPGQMVRYFIHAVDENAIEMRSPRITDTSGLDRSPEYFGTVVRDPSINTSLPVFHWFAERPSRARSRSGSRVSVFYAGEFYDNVFARQRGGATNGSSQKFNFNDDHPFFVNDKLGRVVEFNMNAEGSDPTFVRQPMAFQTYTLAGNESSESFFMAMRVNGEQDRRGRPGIFIEQVNEDFLDRQGLDPDGALYKFVQRSNLNPVFSDVTTGVEKKTRLDEGLDDLRVVVDGLTAATQQERGFSVFDNFNVAQLLNYLAIRSITLDADDVRKNFYLYRDTNGTGQWSIFPWDKDWTFGITGDGGQFLEHPFFGDEAHRKDNALQWNRLYDAVFNDPVLKDMYLRRLRTVMDEILQPPGTENGILEQLAESIAASADGTIPGNIEAIKRFLRDRRETLYNEHVVDPNDTGEIIDLIPEFSPADYFVPTNDDLGRTWTGLEDPVNIAEWKTGPTGFGFASRFDDFVNTQVVPADSCPECVAIYVRMPFEVADASSIQRMTLQMRYDDGFLAYLNGEEILRVGIIGDDPITYTTDARSHSNREAVEYVNFNLSEFTHLLRDGKNVLAIHVINSSPTSNDMLVQPRLVNGIISDAAAAGIPLAQIGNPSIQFGEIEHNPPTTQAEEYIELKNDNDVAVDISGWRIEGGIEHSFHAGTVIPAGRSLYISPDVIAFQNRSNGPSGGQGLFVQGNYRGHLSNFGETISLIAKDGSTIDTQTTPITPSDAQRFLRVTEFHYNPLGPSESTEFIELLNTSDAVTLSLAGIQFSRGPETPFVIPDGISLAPGQLLVIAKDRDALLEAFPTTPPDRVIGNYVGSLRNSGERIKIEDVNGSTIAEFTYDDQAPWPTAADGLGQSLNRISLTVNADDPTNWRAAAPSPGFLSSVNPDLNADGAVTPADVDFACFEVERQSAALDLNQDGVVNLDDVDFYITRVLGTSAGDSNLDRVFNSQDLVTVFRAAKYEVNDGTATWEQGDWNCDGNFNSSDLVAAFRAGRYVAAAHATNARNVVSAATAETPSQSPSRRNSNDQKTRNRSVDQRRQRIEFVDIAFNDEAMQNLPDRSFDEPKTEAIRELNVEHNWFTEIHI